MASIEQIKELRELTGVSIIECKKALDESNGDFEKAKEILRKLGKAIAEKKSSREVGQGIIATYVHSNKKVGVMLDIRCESDFVADGELFTELAHEICMQIAAMDPKYVKEADIPESIIAEEKRIYVEQMKDSGKPENILGQIIEGKLKKYKEQRSLLSQLWIKDDSKTIKNVIDEFIAKIGENIEVKQFSRFEI